jgi:hypothetical protein
MEGGKLQKLITTKGTTPALAGGAREVHKGKEKGRAGTRPFSRKKEFLDLIIFALEESKNKCADADKADVWK